MNTAPAAAPANAPSATRASPAPAAPLTDLGALRRLLAEVVAPWVAALDLQVVAARPGHVELELPVAPGLVHGGGVLCGQALMATADTAMILAIATLLGGFRPMTTVQLQTSFMKAVPKDAQHVRVTAHVLRQGKRLVFGEIEMHADASAEHCAHATTTYALL